jgi:predicted DsbA family dithiol-disulfide isomerase
MDEVVYDHMMDWCHGMKRRLERMMEESDKRK